MHNVILINNFRATLYENVTSSQTFLKLTITSPSASELNSYISEFGYQKIMPLIIINNQNNNDYEIFYVSNLSYFSPYYNVDITLRGAENTTAKNWNKNSCYVVCAPTAFLLMQYNSLKGLIEPSPLKHTDSLELQTGRTNDTYTAQAEKSVIIGKNNIATVRGSTIVGFDNSIIGNDFYGSYNIILGHNNTINNQGSSYLNVIIGSENNVPAGNGTTYTIGRQNNILGNNSFVIGNNNSVNTNGEIKILGDNHNINLTDSKFNNHKFLFIGNNNNVVPNGGTFSYNDTAIVIGENCQVARGSILLGGKNDILGVSNAISFGNRVGIVTTSGGVAWTMRSNPFEIGGAAPTYANNTTYYYGDIVRHPTNTNIYCQLTNLTVSPTTGTYPSYSSSSYNANDWTEFTRTPPTNYTWFNVQEGMFFIPTDLYILIWRFSTLSGTPSISIGTASNPGLILNNYNFVPTSSTAYYQIPLPNPTNYVQGPETVILRVNTLSTGGRALCVALLTGYFIIAPEATTV